MPYRRTYSEAQSDAQTRLEANTPLTNFGPLSIGATLVSQQSVEVERVYKEIDRMYSVFDPTVAAGDQLDRIAFIFGAQRNGSVYASDITYTNVYFKINPSLGLNLAGLINQVYPAATKLRFRQRLEDLGYIDSALSPTSLTIPSDMILTSTDGIKQYRTLNAATITNESSETFIQVVAATPGSTHNIISNELTKHRLGEVNGLRDLATYIICTNKFPINNGGDPISDNTFRYNLSLLPSSFLGNEARIRSAVLGIPGIRNILLERGRYGNGTLHIMVEGVNPIASDSLLSATKEIAEAASSGSEIIYVDKPDYLGIELNLDIIVSPGANRSQITETVRSTVIQYINDISIGGELIWNRIVSEITSVAGVNDFNVGFFKLGEYDSINKINKNQIILRTVNQRSDWNEKFYTDAGLVSICCRT